MKKIYILLLVALVLIAVGLILYDNRDAPDGEMTLLEQCLAQDYSYKKIVCLEPYFIELTHASSAENAMREAQALQQEGMIDDCHLIAHFIGGANLEKNNDDIGAALASCSLGCIEGCFHGVLEEYVGERISNPQLTAELPGLCATVAADPTEHSQCVHGIGHGLLAHGYSPIVDAADACSVFSGDFLQSSCLGGVFMENMAQYLTLDEAPLREKIPIVCSEVASDPRLMPRCLDAIGEGLMFYTGHDMTRSKTLCQQLSEEYIEACQLGVEREAKNFLNIDE